MSPVRAVEVRSPGERTRAVAAKVDAWLRHGARAAWVADPRARTVTVHEPGIAARTFRDGDEVDGGSVLPGFRAAVRELFPPDRDTDR